MAAGACERQALLFKEGGSDASRAREVGGGSKSAARGACWATRLGHPVRRVRQLIRPRLQLRPFTRLKRPTRSARSCGGPFTHALIVSVVSARR